MHQSTVQASECDLCSTWLLKLYLDTAALSCRELQVGASCQSGRSGRSAWVSAVAVSDGWHDMPKRSYLLRGKGLQVAAAPPVPCPWHCLLPLHSSMAKAAVHAR